MRSDHGLGGGWPGPGECLLLLDEGVLIGGNTWSHRNGNR